MPTLFWNLLSHLPHIGGVHRGLNIPYQDGREFLTDGINSKDAALLPPRLRSQAAIVHRPNQSCHIGKLPHELILHTFSFYLPPVSRVEHIDATVCCQLNSLRGTCSLWAMLVIYILERYVQNFPSTFIRHFLRLSYLRNLAHVHNLLHLPQNSKIVLWKATTFNAGGME
ncbi:hypothetical protein BT69DRAFT_634519 [Atractiella rhizophila]|nr:hypothetical protein BT69DRAFT_634519 [Atractiella rhizophila]